MAFTVALITSTSVASYEQASACCRYNPRMQPSSETGMGQPDAALARQMRQIARNIFLHALREASIESAFRRHVHLDRSVLRIGEDLYDVSGERRLFAVSI